MAKKRGCKSGAWLTYGLVGGGWRDSWNAGRGWVREGGFSLEKSGGVVARFWPIQGRGVGGTRTLKGSDEKVRP